jgi:hypothetical protein
MAFAKCLTKRLLPDWGSHGTLTPEGRGNRDPTLNVQDSHDLVTPISASCGI